MILSQAALARTGLIQPGTLVNYEYRLRLPAGTDAAAWMRSVRAAFPDAGWQLRGSADASPSLQSALAGGAMGYRGNVPALCREP